MTTKDRDHFPVKAEYLKAFDEQFPSDDPVQYILAFNEKGEVLLFTRETLEVIDEDVEEEQVSRLIESLAQNKGAKLASGQHDSRTVLISIEVGEGMHRKLSACRKPLNRPPCRDERIKFPKYRAHESPTTIKCHEE